VFKNILSHLTASLQTTERRASAEKESRFFRNLPTYFEGLGGTEMSNKNSLRAYLAAVCKEFGFTSAIIYTYFPRTSELKGTASYALNEAKIQKLVARLPVDAQPSHEIAAPEFPIFAAKVLESQRFIRATGRSSLVNKEGLARVDIDPDSRILGGPILLGDACHGVAIFFSDPLTRNASSQRADTDTWALPEAEMDSSLTAVLRLAAFILVSGTLAIDNSLLERQSVANRTFLHGLVRLARSIPTDGAVLKSPEVQEFDLELDGLASEIAAQFEAAATAIFLLERPLVVKLGATAPRTSQASAFQTEERHSRAQIPLTPENLRREFWLKASVGYTNDARSDRAHYLLAERSLTMLSVRRLEAKLFRSVQQNRSIWSERMTFHSIRRDLLSRVLFTSTTSMR
jgi:hypothetical protein